MAAFTAGILLNINSDYSGIEGVFSESNLINFGVDIDTQLSIEDENYQVSVPRVDVDLTDEQRTSLEAN